MQPPPGVCPGIEVVVYVTCSQVWQSWPVTVVVRGVEVPYDDWGSVRQVVRGGEEEMDSEGKRTLTRVTVTVSPAEGVRPMQG